MMMQDRERLSARRYNSATDQNKRKFGGRLQKVAVNAGFSCPNRDGTISYGGCTFCNNEGFNPSYCRPADPVHEQITQGLIFLKKRYPRSRKYVAYLQAYSNTHAGIDRLRAVYGEALSHPEISGLVIGTRPDCVDEEKLDYLAALSNDYYIKIEYGLESCYDDTLQRINRGHSFADAVRAIHLTADRGLECGVHMLFGLPGESRQQMLDQVDLLNALPVHTVKFHQLQIVAGTRMALDYRRHPEMFSLFSLEEYLDFIVSFVERLRPDIAIERLSGEVPLRLNEGMSWGSIRTDQVMLRFEERLRQRDTWQGRLLTKRTP